MYKYFYTLLEVYLVFNTMRSFHNIATVVVFRD